MSRRSIEEWKRIIAHKQRKQRERIANDLWARIKNDPKPEHINRFGFTYNLDVNSTYPYTVSDAVVKQVAEEMAKKIDEEALRQITGFSINKA